MNGISKSKRTNFKKMYFLDRNLIIKMDIYNDIKKGKREKMPENDRMIIRHLREKDKKKNVFTPIFSLFEGSKKQIREASEINNDIKRELLTLGTFFKKTIIDDSFLDSDMHELFLEAINSEEHRIKINSHINFLKEISLIIPRKVGSRERDKKKDEIINVAKKYNIGVRNPIVMATLTWVYGSEIGNGILKIAKGINDLSGYNGVMDIDYFSNFSFIVGRKNNIDNLNYPSKININKYEFLTNDKSLNKFFKCFDFSTARSNSTPNCRRISINFSAFGKNNIPREVIEFYKSYNY